MVRTITIAVLLVAGVAHAQVPDTVLPNQPTATITPAFDGRRSWIPNLVPYESVRRPKVGLVLSGGGARGIASIGVLKAFERRGIPIDMIVGTSIGSIIGGLYAAGYSTGELDRLALTLDWAEVLSYDDDARRKDMFLDQKLANDRSLVVLRFDGFEPVIPAAYSTGQRLTYHLNLLALQGIYHPSPSFDDLRVPFRAVSTDLISGRRYVFKSGDLSEAMRASVAVPLLFAAVRKDTMELVDGGLLSNMPVDVAREEGMDLVVAVDVTSALRPPGAVSAPWEIGEQIFGIMMQDANRRARESADAVITPALGDHLTSDFTGLATLMAAGEAAADSVLDRLEERIADLRKVLLQQPGDRTYLRPVIGYDATLIDRERRSTIDALSQRDTISDGDLRQLVTDLYATGAYEQIVADVTPLENSARVFIRGRRHPVLRDIAVSGATGDRADSLQRVFSSLVGKPLNPLHVQRAVEEMLMLYRATGLPIAHVQSMSFDPANGSATVAIDEGIIRRMDIVGTQKTKDYVIWRELPFRRGDVLQSSKVAEGLANIYSTNLFEQASMSVETEGEGDGHHVVKITARERSTELIRVGLRVDNERNIQPSVDVRDENFLGIGAELGLRASGGTRNSTLVADFKAVRIFDSYLTSDIRAYVASRDINVYGDAPRTRDDRFDRLRIGEIRETRRGGSLSFGTQLERLGNVTVTGRWERHHVYNIFNAPITNEQYDISSIRFATRIDTQDRYPYPTDGVNMSFLYETALVRTAGAIGFTKLYISYEVATSLGRRHTIIPRVRLGLGDDAVPTSEQFSLGGADSFHGYREDNARGRQLLSTSLEYRYRLPFRVFVDTYLKARYDIGSIWLRTEEIRLVDLKHAVGFGVGFDTPAGPAEIAVGRSFYLRSDLLERPLALGPTVISFSIGYPLD
jgi:NTE family protein